LQNNFSVGAHCIVRETYFTILACIQIHPMLFIVAFLLGFVGYLPPGNINLTVVQLSIDHHKKQWQAFILLAALMEFIYCYASMAGLEILRGDARLITVLNWSGVAIFFALGLFSLLHTEKPESEKTLFSASIKRGVLVAIFNPLQIPFWLVWGVYVMENGWVKDTRASIGLFTVVCTIGTIVVLYMYALAGKAIVARLNVNRNLLNKIIGGLLVFLAVLQTIKLLTA
jgi:threonine/homoserine/homoserine lactone efflux protein